MPMLHHYLFFKPPIITSASQPFYLLNRGDWDRRGPRVTPGIPTVLEIKAAPFRPEATEAGTTGRRLAFARWLTHPHNPLTARVFVNRVWRYYFGRGIVATVGDFGRTGQLPSHPELLDHLASRFMDDGWSMKRLHRRIVLSATYRQASTMRKDASLRDPENQWLWRMPLRRRDAESLRDSILSLSGTFNSSRFGPSTEAETLPDGQVVTPSIADRCRKSIYMEHRRLKPETFLEMFDAPRLTMNCVERRTSTVVNQSLLLLHSSFVEAHCSALADRIHREVGADREKQIESLYERLYARVPNQPELDRAREFFAEIEGEASIDGLAELALVLINSAEFLYID